MHVTRTILRHDILAVVRYVYRTPQGGLMKGEQYLLASTSILILGEMQTYGQQIIDVEMLRYRH